MTQMTQICADQRILFAADEKLAGEESCFGLGFWRLWGAAGGAAGAGGAAAVEAVDLTR
jgi:hypothetical protein